MRDFLRQRLAAVLLVIVIVVALSATRLANLLTELWWFQAIGASDVFTGIIGARVLLAVVAGAFLTAVIAVNLQIARRMRPLVIPETPQQEQIEAYRSQAEPFLGWLIGAVALVFGVSSGLAVASQWELFLLWRNGGSFGTVDPQFGKDVGFYVFDLPFLQYLQGWLFTSLLLVMLLTAGAHLLLGGIRPDAPRDKVLPTVKAHLSVLLALVLAVRAWGYWLDRYLLNFSERGTVTGASYTDVNAELPGLVILVVISVVAIVLTLVNLRRQGFVLPGAAIALLLLGSVILQGVYPSAIQRLQVDPQELEREREFIDRNLAATLEAYGLDGLDLGTFNVTDDLDREQIADNAATFTNIRLWDPQLLLDTYEQIQALRPFYDFADVDIDRYVIDGELRQVMLAARELDEGASAFPDAWQNRHLTYTHGYGIVASQVNTATRAGQPVYLSLDIPSRPNTDVPGAEAIVPTEQPGIYYGEDGYPEYSIVATGQPELDYEDPDTQDQVTTSYDGAGGVPVGTFGRRLAYALRYGEANLVLSDLLTDESRVIHHREIGERVRQVAPYLRYDRDPYAAVVDGEIVWIVDAYTTSANYPYAEYAPFETGAAVSGAFVRETVNYVRNSVKAVVDAYDGTVTLYQVDEDPIIEAWRGAFPSLFRDLEDAPEELAAHFRYPEDLFKLQSRVYQSYHIPGADAFYNQADLWDIPADAARRQNLGDAAGNALLDPYYLIMKLPGEDTAEFVTIQPYEPRERDNMIGWLAARSDAPNYGELFAVRFPTDSQVLGPTQAHVRIEQEPQISQEFSLLDQRGSSLIRGNLLVLPIEESIVFIEPLFLQNDQARIPELFQVALVMGDRVVMRSTLSGALDALVTGGPPVLEADLQRALENAEEPDDPDAPPAEEQTEPTDSGTSSDDPDELIQQALDAFEQADAALADGDLGEYQRLVGEARDLLERAARLQGVQIPGSEPTPTPTPTDTGTNQPSDAATPTPTETSAR